VASAIQESQGIARGFRLREGEHPSALNGFLYSLLRGTKQQRRALVLSMLKQFDETSKNPLAQLLYLADNLASFPYQVKFGSQLFVCLVSLFRQHKSNYSAII
jgi:cohesin loading factor subunit SCC2